MNKIQEADLARALQRGDDRAFDEFVAHFRGKVFHYTWLMCGHREDAEEVSQETMIKVFEKLSQLDDPARVRPWVFRIARNQCLMLRRKSVFAPTHELSLDQFMPAVNDSGGHRHLEIADWSALPDRALLTSELRTEIERGLRELPEPYRAVILLRDVEELSTADAAEILDVSQDVVKTRLHRARLALRADLDSYLRGK